jgi:STE24 endopeptidase
MKNQVAVTWQCVQTVRRARVIVLALGLLFALPGSAQPEPVKLTLISESSIASDHLSPATSAQPYTLPPDRATKARTLGAIRTRLHFGSELWQLAVLLLVLATGTASRLANRVSMWTSRNWLRPAIFSAMLLVLLWIVAELPAQAIGHSFSLRYGISVEAWPAWLLDELKGIGLTVALEAPLLMLLYGLMHWQWSRRFYWAWMALFMIPLLVLGTVLLPAVIEPMFNTFSPLAESHPELVQQLEKVVARTGTSIPPDRMFLMKASDKSNGLNAYVTGLGPTKRIVVWDTTADRMPEDQILFTFAHESGHYVLNHIPKGLAIGSIGIFLLFGFSVWLARGLLAHRGAVWNIPSLRSLPGLAVLLFALTLLMDGTEPIQNFGSRYVEHEADIYGQEAIHGIVSDPQKTAVATFNTLGAAYLDDPDPSPLLEFWTYDHPSIQTRARFAAQYDPWAEGKQPQFFPKH